MEATPLAISDVVLLEPKVFEDERGFFFESFNQRTFEQSCGRSPVFVQDNHSRSSSGVLRGLHYQLPPQAQGKLVRVVHGRVFDVAVDIRRSSRAYGHWVGAYLSADNKKQLWIPEGFAHGFLTLSDAAEIVYKTTDFYAPELERCIRWDDAAIGIAWPTTPATPRLSPKDAVAPILGDAETFG